MATTTTSMEGLEMDHLYATDTAADFGASILAKFSPTSSTNEFHQHICSVIGTTSQTLREGHNNNGGQLSFSPVIYLGAIFKSLGDLSLDPTCPTPTLDALVVLLSLLLPANSPGILIKMKARVLDCVVRVLRGGRVSENGVVAGLKCLSYVIAIRDSGDWEDVSNSYGILLSYVTDNNPKVRKQSHMCVRDVLQSFQGSTFLSSASERFTNMLQKLLLLTRKKGAPAEKGARDILHVLDALKDCLPYMSLIHKTNILKMYKTLVAVHTPLVARRITDSLNILCLQPMAEVNPQALVDLLSALTDEKSYRQASADALTFTARLLDVGMRKVHSINKEICIENLPPVFKSLQDIFGSGFEEAKFAAAEAMKTLIKACIDEDLIKQGVGGLNTTSDINNKKSAPSVIEKLCDIIGRLLGNEYHNELDMSFQVVSVMFDKLGQSSGILMRKTLVSLASIEAASDEDFPERKQLQECIGSALGAMGPEVFLSIIPLKLQADNLPGINDWLFPILKQYTIGAPLRFYVESLLGAVEYLKQKAHNLKLEGKTQSSRILDSVISHVWSLLPAFCNYSSDTAESFNIVKRVLRNALDREPDLHGIICFSLQILIQQNRCVVEGTSYSHSDKQTISTERAMVRYTKEVASANLAVLRSSAPDFFSALFEVFMKSSTDPGGCLLATIGEFASIADKDVVSNFFHSTMRKFLKATPDACRAENSKSSMQIDNSLSDDNSLSRARARFFELAVSLLPGLGIKDTEILYSVVKPALKAVDGTIQKKAYKALSMVLKNSNGFIARNQGDLPHLMMEVLPSCHFSAKRHRLDCLYHLIVFMAKNEAELTSKEYMSSFLTEILLALKEANKKTRNRAYDVLVQIGRACEDEENNGKKERLLQFFGKVLGCVAGGTPHMISAAVKGLARLAYEFSDLLSAAYQVLPHSIILLQMKNREITKANLGLLKVLVAKSQSENLQHHLRVMVEVLLKWPNETKNHFKAKVKHLLEMLVKKCGLDAVKAVMPEEHMKLLTNIRKIKERRERKLAGDSETRSYLSKATTSRQSEWGHTKIFSDFDEETGDDNGSMLSSKFKSRASSLRSKKTTKSGKILSENLLQQLEDEPLDLLDQRKTRLALRSGGHLKRKHDSDDELEIDEDGKLIITEEGKQKGGRSSDHDSDDDRTETASFVSTNPKKIQKRRKTSDSGWAYTGNEYASKKARGDLKKKGKLEPYAYWPLDRKMLSRRPEHRAAARRGMSSVVKLTKQLEGKSVASALAVRSKKKKVHKKR